MTEDFDPERIVEFTCEGCGDQVIGFGYRRVPHSQLCSTCEWMCDHLPDPDEFWAAYSRHRGTNVHERTVPPPRAPNGYGGR